jgi:hypothetical protein
VRKCLPTYFQQLPKGTRNAALEKAKKKHTDPLPSHDDVFWAAFEHARQTEAVMNRVTTFLNLYGFCRNTALVAFINAAVLIGWALGNAPAHTLYWGLVALVLGIGMLFRYLKFFRLYAVELFTAFAHSK